MHEGQLQALITHLVKFITRGLEQVEATDVFAEEEVEYSLRRIMDAVEGTLTSVSSLNGNPKINVWKTPFYDIEDLTDLEFDKLEVSQISPLLPPVLSRVEMELDWGLIPTFDDLKKFMDRNPYKAEESWTSIREASADSMLRKRFIDEFSKSSENESNLNYNHARKIKNSVFVTKKGNLVGGGTNVVLNALAAYLRYVEGTSRDDWQEIHEKLQSAEVRDGASFGALFRSALCLGIISRRRVYYEAIKYEQERNAGFLSPFGYSAATVAAVAGTVCSIEWYWLMALKSQTSNEGRYAIRIWRWNGYLIQYTVVGHEGPPILLVHGFGAFLEHYRDNIRGIADAGHRVWSVTLLGFGKSEKPNVVYTEIMWAELLRDFIIEVVGEPVHLVGNSLGGYFVSIVSGLWPSLVKSAVLINSAGNVMPQYSSLQISKERSTSGAAWVGARLLLPFLRLSIRSIVNSCYPTKPERADDWLIDQMLRASNDPGGLALLESIFGFNLSIPLNSLFEGFQKKVLIIQGIKDPIVDSESTLAMFRTHLAGVVIREIDAGHCPHDEQPEEVNSIICEWVAAIESKP